MHENGSKGARVPSGATEEEVGEDAREVQHDPRVRVIARTGFAASALLQVLVGVLAIRIAVGDSGGRPDQSGAFAGIAKTPAGGVLLWATAVACFALAAWFLLTAVLRRDREPRTRWGKRIADISKTVLYGVIGAQALRFAVGAGSSSAATERRSSGSLLTVPGGPVVLALIGAATAAVGVFLVVRGVRRGFTADLDLPEGAMGRITVVLGVIGFVARGVAIVAVGVLFVVAAVTVDPAKATGLDGALHAFASTPLGRVVLVGIGAGWCASGLYTAVVAWRAPMR
jgi:hypothetical protein